MNPLPIRVSLLPDLVPPGALAGRAVVVVDVLRASSTIVQALQAGAECVVPCSTPDDARSVRSRFGGHSTLLGGERAGVRIEGFDLGNSPAEYIAGVVARKILVFTTTNGTRAIHASREAQRLFIGCFGNLCTLVQTLARVALPVHIVCAGTGGQVGADDCLFAGRVVSACRALGFHPDECDQALIAESCYLNTARQPHGVLDALRASIGGRNLISIGFGSDVDLCAREDWAPCVPEFCISSGTIRVVDAHHAA